MSNFGVSKYISRKQKQRMKIKEIKILGIFMFVAMAFGMSAQTNHPHSNVHQNLIANQANVKDQIRIIDNNTTLGYFEYEELEPEPDIYTEGWDSDRVNPFKESDVPNSAVIDVTNYAIPHHGKVTSNYGYRKRFRRMHKGIDIGIRSNDTIYAAFDGKVRLTNYERRGYGYYIIIRHTNDLETVYGHLNKFLVKPDQFVKAGEPIALGGSTGRSTGPHLHFETRYMGYAINPAAIFDFANKTTHTDTYTFTKSTYTQSRNYSPSNTQQANTYRASDNASRKTYTVRKGDTLSTIARKNGISLTRLCRLNGMKKTDMIRPGQKLKIK